MLGQCANMEIQLFAPTTSNAARGLDSMCPTPPFGTQKAVPLYLIQAPSEQATLFALALSPFSHLDIMLCGSVVCMFLLAIHAQRLLEQT